MERQTTEDGVAQLYARLVTECDLEGLMALFAEDAVVRQRKREFRGVAAIRGFYGSDVLPLHPVAEGVEFTSRERRVVFKMEVTVQSSRGATTAEVVDLFEVDENGRIVSLEIYFQ
jgi:ketosteroid isomerase-like protein